ncbi:MAG TPA: FMN-binding protein, partial [Bacillota bacterium]|nr:FMN-binding protein [Bacillota bacterium]
VSADGYSSSSPITMLIVVNNDLTVRGYKVVNHTESPGYGADIVENDFNIQTITDLSGFDAVAGVTFTSDGILRCFELVSERVANDFGGGIQ